MKPYNELEILYALEMAVEKFYEQPNVFSSEEQNTVVSKEFLFINMLVRLVTYNSFHR